MQRTRAGIYNEENAGWWCTATWHKDLCSKLPSLWALQIKKGLVKGPPRQGNPYTGLEVRGSWVTKAWSRKRHWSDGIEREREASPPEPRKQGWWFWTLAWCWKPLKGLMQRNDRLWSYLLAQEHWFKRGQDWMQGSSWGKRKRWSQGRGGGNWGQIN